MAGASVIGALRVDLGLNSAQFTAGLKKAETGLGSFGRAAAAGLQLVSVAALAAGAAMGVAVKHAIDHADALSKAAQKAGVTTEALSRLAYAASYSDVSLEGTTAALTKLSKSMADAAQNTKGSAASAFAALGISVKDAGGNLRDSGEVFTDIADRFARLQDGSTKTALAMQLFGKSGADLIPLLNGGATEIKRFSDEADRLGITLSTQTGREAERFNDTMGLVGQILQGVANKAAEKALPALQDLASTLASPQFAKGAADIAQAIVTSMDLIAKAVGPVVEMFENFGRQLSFIGEQLKKIPVLGVNTGINLGGFQVGPGVTPANSSGSPDDRGGFGGIPITVHGGSTDNSGIDLSKFTSGNFGKAGTFDTDQIDTYRDHMLDLANSLKDTADPFAEISQRFTDLNQLMGNSPQLADQIGESLRRNSAAGVAAAADLASGYGTALSAMFKGNKAIAVATAVVDGISSVAKTLSAYGFTPIGVAAAGAAGLAAAANIANILSTNENSTSMKGSVGGGNAGAAASGVAPGNAFNFTFKGSGNVNIDDFVDQFTKQLADGGHNNFIKVVRTA